MLKEFSIKDNEFSFTKEKRSELGLRLASIQRRCIEKNIPVIIMIDGWESSGKGYVMNDLVRELDSKHTLVHMFDDFARENDYAYTRQFWRALPAKGSFGVFYRSMYFTLFNDLKSKKKLKNERIEDLRNLEKMLTDDNTVILKFFLHIDEDTIKENVTVTDSIIKINDSIKIKVEHLDSVKNAKVIEVQTLDNDSTLKLFYELVSE